MNTTLENNYLKVSVKSKGAELFGVFRKDYQLEYMWGGDPSVWGKTSPILFPIVGTLKNNTFIYGGERYILPRHGFARDSEFEIAEQDQQHVVFVLKESVGSLKNYPFDFELFVKYALDNDVLKVTYEVRNPGTKLLYFSIGAHPAFKVPLTKETQYEDYFLEFDAIENARRWPINKEGLIEPVAGSFFNDSSRVDISHKLFQDDALVFKDIRSNKIFLKTDRDVHGIEFSFEGFPFLGIWAAKGGNFVCIEPWCGIADSADHDQLLNNKEGIQTIPAGDIFTRQWAVKCF